jgi:ring-1,2-phenylacetyl-CoA epoxidase subunit PaaE
VTPPGGEFTIDVDHDTGLAILRRRRRIRHHAGALAGLHDARQPTRLTLDRDLREPSRRTVMFLDELEGLKDRYPDRLQIVHVLSREDPGLDLFSGRIDAAKLEPCSPRSSTPTASTDGSCAAHTRWSPVHAGC